MDAIALLCTLHADGPATLKRLRQVDCSTLEALEGFDIERLAAILGVAPAGARRFVREARHLRERIGSSALGELERDADEVRVDSAALDRAADAVGEPAASAGASASLGYREQALVERVLETWRQRDAQEAQRDAQDAQRDAQRAGEPPEPERAAADDERRPEHRRADEFTSAGIPGAEAEAWNARMREQADSALAGGFESEVGGDVLPRAPAREAARESAHGLGRELEPQARQPRHAPHPGEPCEGGLVPGCVDGLDERLCASLRAAGIATLAALADSDPLLLARSTATAYTRLERLRALARRALAAVPFAGGEAERPASALPRAARVPHLAGEHAALLLPQKPYPLREAPTRMDLEGPGGPFV